MSTHATSVDVVVSAAVTRDLDLALAGVTPSGHVLGEPFASGSAPGPGVWLRLPEGLELADPSLPLVLRDEEFTPLATLTIDPIDAVNTLVHGTLNAGRARESGAGRAVALDLTAASLTGAGLAWLSRPVTNADVATLAQWAASTADETQAPTRVVLVPDNATDSAGIPVERMLAIARAGLAAAGVQAQVRTAPTAVRGIASDRVMLDLLARHLGADEPLVLSADDGSAGADAWARARVELDEARTPAVLADLPAGVADQVRGWRPERPRRGVVMLFSGFSGSGKSTVARDVAHALRDEYGHTVSLLDGDVVRQMLSSGLGFDRASRILNVRRIGYVAAEIARHGGWAIAAPIAPYESTRAEVRSMVEATGADLLLVHVNTSLEECERRDLKGLYAKARAGIVPEFTGISDPYDVPADPAIRVDTAVLGRTEARDAVLTLLTDGGWLVPADTHTTTEGGRF